MHSVKGGTPNKNKYHKTHKTYVRLKHSRNDQLMATVIKKFPMLYLLT